MKKLIYLFTVIATLALSSCGVSSDEATETMIRGEWVSEAIDLGDNVYVFTHMDLKKNTHSFVETFVVVDGDDDEVMGTCSLSGIWHASKTKLEQEYKESSFKTEYANGFAKMDLQPFFKELKNEFFKDGNVYVTEIVTAGWNELVLKDEEGELEYYERPEE